jgi:hypothetical protein
VDEQERRAACEEIAERMYIAGLGWNLDAILKLTDPWIGLAKRLHFAEKMPEPTPVERGVLNRYQDRRRKRG